MRAIICDICDDVCEEGRSTVIEFPLSTLGQPEEKHLCPECSKKLRKWLKGEPEYDYSPSEITF